MSGEAISQSQSQQQFVTVTVESGGDPELERRIFSQVHSAGRQLRNVSAVLELLLAAHEASGGTFAPAPQAQQAVEAFRAMQLDILKAKSVRDPERLISQLEAMRQVDAQAFARLRDRLNEWLRDK